MAFVREHWRAFGFVALLAAAFTAGRMSVPQPEVHEQETLKATDDKHEAVQQKSTTGPKETLRVDFAPCPPAPPLGGSRGPAAPPTAPFNFDGFQIANVPGEQVASISVEREGPSTVETHTVSQEHATEDRKVDLTVTPSPRLPWLELQLGEEDVLHPSLAGVRPAARVRLGARTWLEISAKPFEHTTGPIPFPVGAAAAISF